MSIDNVHLFNKSERSTFKYWFAHYCAFNMTALNLRCWKFRFLFHDIEKPWLRLILRDYQKVQKLHRKWNSHHIEYFVNNLKRGKVKCDFLGMVIDWECGRFTKASAPLPARDNLYKYAEKLIKEYPTVEYQGRHASDVLIHQIVPILNKLGL